MLFKLLARARRTPSDGGFTLIELLVVVGIIGVLAAVAIPVYIGQSRSAATSVVREDLHSAKVAEVVYYSAHASSWSQSATSTTPIGSTLSASGFNLSASGDYTTAPEMQLTSTASGAGFCIMAQSMDGTWWAVSENSGVVAGGCTNGAITGS